MPVRATSYLRVERERPLMTTHSLYSGNIMNYYFYLKHVREGVRVEVFMLKIRHYLNYKDRFYLCVQQKTNAFFGCLRTILEVSVVRCYNYASSYAVASLLSEGMP